jgi:hypothetical protein
MYRFDSEGKQFIWLKVNRTQQPKRSERKLSACTTADALAELVAVAYRFVSGTNPPRGLRMIVSRVKGDLKPT